MAYQRILIAGLGAAVRQEAPECFHDLNLDRIVPSITASREDYNLAPFFHTPLHELDPLRTAMKSCSS